VGCKTEELEVTVKTGRRVEIIDPVGKTVRDQDSGYGYKKLLLATGGRPRRLPFADAARLIYYRTLADYRRLLECTKQQGRIAVIGGGFIGCEMAAALRAADREVVLIFPEETPARRILPALISQELAACFEQHGVELAGGVKPSLVDCGDLACRLVLEDGRSLTAGTVVAGIGILPCTELAVSAGLEVEDGIVVNRHLQTTDASVYAAGDVIRFYNPALQKRMRVEHEDHALESGRTAGKNMAGAEETYDHLPGFYSTLFDVGYEAVGELDPSLETGSLWNGLHEKGLWAFCRDGCVRGVLLWNIFGKMDQARALITGREPMDSAELTRRLAVILEAS
jgi:3-phenylpropionate/trans-cinnamate dioxygenase ferredoxin reductase component